jgi:hypothetical protein
VKHVKMSGFRVALIPVAAEQPVERNDALADSADLRPAQTESNAADHGYRVYVSHPLVRLRSDRQARAEALNLLGLALGRGAALLALGAFRISVKAFKTARDISERQFTKEMASEPVVSRKRSPRRSTRSALPSRS